VLRVVREYKAGPYKLGRPITCNRECWIVGGVPFVAGIRSDSIQPETPNSPASVYSTAASCGREKMFADLNGACSLPFSVEDGVQN
jgi:hypothetical protein